MRVAVTEIDPRLDLREDVLIDADDARTMAELVAALASPASDTGTVVSLAGRRTGVATGERPTL